MSLAGYGKIIRPMNAGVSGITAGIAYFIAGGTQPLFAALLFFIVLVICAAGNVLNDYFDLEIDKVNRPDRPIPSGAVTPRGALVWAALLFGAGIIAVCFTNVWCLGVAVLNTVLLIIYAAKFKGIPLLGNLSVAYLSGSIFLFGGFLVGPESFLVMLPLFAITFFGTLARELLKDAEDIEGDRIGGARTLPMRIGVRRTGVLAVIFVLCAVLFSFVPFLTWGIVYLVLIGVVDAFIILVTIRTLGCDDPHQLSASGSTMYLKYGMFAALFVFLLMEILSVFL
ncbi:1,4-dihydroxy-2-naphthoate octaprenyltransferase [bioreactor metagenome]|uniref:1,4-dihydroxy-2-naphthoate octaprenyltransferase n=1 Tax=bioreactor metagenome TaxID=1076179 RepID=A0A644UKU0_9ZZZZ|nr:geranylgeranylglycerol-phosphate geranylgeranyltransferase [Methanocorpusculum sp.]